MILCTSVAICMNLVCTVRWLQRYKWRWSWGIFFSFSVVELWSLRITSQLNHDFIYNAELWNMFSRITKEIDHRYELLFKSKSNCFHFSQNFVPISAVFYLIWFIWIQLKEIKLLLKTTESRRLNLFEIISLCLVWMFSLIWYHWYTSYRIQVLICFDLLFRLIQ